MGRGPCGIGLHSDSSVRDVRFINTYCSPVVLRGRDIELGPSCPFPPWQEGRPRAEKERRAESWPRLRHLPAVTLDTSCFLPGPLTFLRQNEGVGSEGFQEVLLLL